MIYFNLLRKEYALALAKAILSCVKTGRTKKVEKVLPIIKKEVFGTYTPENSFKQGKDFFAQVDTKLIICGGEHKSFSFYSNRIQKYSVKNGEKTAFKYLEDHWDLTIFCKKNTKKEFKDINIISHYNADKENEILDKIAAKADKRARYSLQKEAAEAEFLGADYETKRYMIDKQISQFITNINMCLEGHAKFYNQLYNAKNGELTVENNTVDINSLCDQFLTDRDFNSYWFLVSFNKSCAVWQHYHCVPEDSTAEDVRIERLIAEKWETDAKKLTQSFGEALKASKCNK